MNQPASYLLAHLGTELHELRAALPHAERIGACCIDALPVNLLRALLEK